jgi:hypothetical protein
MDEKEGNIVDLAEFFEQEPPVSTSRELTPIDYLAMGVDALSDNLVEANGMLAITFNDEGTPNIVWAGRLDPVAVLETLEIAKREFQKQYEV